MFSLYKVYARDFLTHHKLHILKAVVNIGEVTTGQNAKTNWPRVVTGELLPMFFALSVERVAWDCQDVLYMRK